MPRCSSRMESLSGRAQGAYERLSSAISRAADSEPRLRLWALTVLAEIATGLGRDAAAEQHFREALGLDIRNAYLLAAYADLLLDRNRAGEVATLLQDEDRIDGLLLRRALAKARLALGEAGDDIAALEARFGASRLRGDLRHRREEARFLLHLQGDAEGALRVARENWQRQKEPWDARLVLETALAAEAPEGARSVLDWLKETGLRDRNIHALAQRLNGDRG